MIDLKTKEVLELFKHLLLSADLYSNPELENEPIPSEVLNSISILKDSPLMSGLLGEFESEVFNNCISLAAEERKIFLEYLVKRFYEKVGFTFLLNNEIITEELRNASQGEPVDLSLLSEDEQHKKIWEIVSDQKSVELSGHKLHLFCLENMFRYTMKRIGNVSRLLKIPYIRSEEGLVLFNEKEEIPDLYNDGNNWKIKFNFKSIATTVLFLRTLIQKGLISVDPYYKEIIDPNSDDANKAPKIKSHNKPSSQKVQARTARSFDQAIDFGDKSHEYFRKLFSPDYPFDPLQEKILKGMPSLEQIEGNIL